MIKEERWKEIGKLSKNIRNELIELRKLSGEVKMKKKEVDLVLKSLKSLDQYRSSAENLMFSYGIRDLKIFYGSDEE